MKVKVTAVFVLGVMALAVYTPLFAHHGTAAFDMTKKITMKATVTNWRWANPHCVLEFEAKDEGGNPVQWNVEASNPSDMTNSGWTKQTLHPGDPITVTLFQAKNGKPIGRIATVTLADGRTLGNGFASP